MQGFVLVTVPVLKYTFLSKLNSYTGGGFNVLTCTPMFPLSIRLIRYVALFPK